MSSDPDILLEVSNLQTHFFTDEGVDLSIARGKTLCVVGESGCGKSVMARSILQVVDPPGRIIAGDIVFRPEADQAVNLTKLKAHGAEIRAIRGKDITMIFQEPMTALSPLYTIGNQIIEAIRWHMPLSRHEARQLAIDGLRKVGIPRPSELIDAYTFELSGGMRQRAMIAMALVCGPRLLIADEPTTALDVTTQANILDLIRDLQRDLGMSVMFITHDLGVVAEIADEVAVMYLGIVVEHGPVHEIFADPKHPYTRDLLRSIPRLTSTRKARLDAIRGIVPHHSIAPGDARSIIAAISPFRASATPSSLTRSRWKMGIGSAATSTATSIISRWMRFIQIPTSTGWSPFDRPPGTHCCRSVN